MTAPKSCLVDGCPRAASRRGWCGAHYQWWRLHGDPEAPRARHESPEESFLARTEPLPWSGCLVWTGAVDGDGYGMIRSGGKVVRVHRYTWGRENGPIPEGMRVDHRYHCDPACCEVAHLRLATQTENTRHRRGASRNSRTGVRNVHMERGRYVVKIQCDGIKRRFGSYKTLAEASRVAAEKRLELFGEFAG